MKGEMLTAHKNSQGIVSFYRTKVNPDVAELQEKKGGHPEKPALGFESDALLPAATGMAGTQSLC